MTGGFWTNANLQPSVVILPPPVPGSAYYACVTGVSLLIKISDVLTDVTDVFGLPVPLAGTGIDHIALTATATANGTIHNAPGIPAGAWLPDSPVTLDDTFAALTADGTWTLFIADVDSGTPVPALTDWNLDVTVTAAPKPGQAAVMTILGFIALATQTLRRIRHTKLV